MIPYLPWGSSRTLSLGYLSLRPSLGSETLITSKLYLIDRLQAIHMSISIFERHHRFMGWLGLIASTPHLYPRSKRLGINVLPQAWIFVILGDSYDPSTGTWNPDGLRILRQQDFWFALGMTILCVSSFLCRGKRGSRSNCTLCSVLIPWFTIREVKVDVEIVMFFMNA